MVFCQVPFTLKNTPQNRNFCGAKGCWEDVSFLPKVEFNRHLLVARRLGNELFAVAALLVGHATPCTNTVSSCEKHSSCLFRKKFATACAFHMRQRKHPLTLTRFSRVHHAWFVVLKAPTYRLLFSRF